MRRVPLFDISEFHDGSYETKARIAREFDRTCRDIGFLVLTGHGIAAETRECAFEAMQSFFRQPPEIKQQWAATPHRVRGWRALGATALARTRGDDTPPDLMERFTIGPYDRPESEYARLKQTFLADNHWPSVVPEFEPSIKNYYAKMEKLADTMMRIAALALNLPEHFFSPFFDQHITVMIANYYPRTAVAFTDRQLRAGKHTDYNNITILAPDPHVGGLQVETGSDRWEDVPHVPDSFVINIGDLMARWTNERWVSTMHRVVPSLTGPNAAERLSIAFFHQPNESAEIECLSSCLGANGAKYPAIRSGAYLAEKVNRGWVGKTANAY